MPVALPVARQVRVSSPPNSQHLWRRCVLGNDSRAEAFIEESDLFGGGYRILFYVGEYCVRTIEGATSTLDATLDNNAQTISGTMKSERQDEYNSSEYACSFSNLELET